MDIVLAPRTQAWAGRGRQRRDVPDHVKNLVDSTYRTRKVAEITGITTEQDRIEARELVSLARTHAESLGRRIRVQPYVWERTPNSVAAQAVERIAFEMVDAVPSPRKATP